MTTENKRIAYHIGQRIRARRIILHISQEGLGAQLGGLTQQAISKMERGGEVSGSQLLHLSRILGVSICYFYDGLQPDHVCVAPSYAEANPDRWVPELQRELQQDR